MIIQKHRHPVSVLGRGDEIFVPVGKAVALPVAQGDLQIFVGVVFGHGGNVAKICAEQRAVFGVAKHKIAGRVGCFRIQAMFFIIPRRAGFIAARLTARRSAGVGCARRLCAVGRGCIARCLRAVHRAVTRISRYLRGDIVGFARFVRRAAGHPPPILRDHDKHIRQIPVDGGKMRDVQDQTKQQQHCRGGNGGNADKPHAQLFNHRLSPNT